LSFESGKKLGVTASLINVILPVIGAVATVAFVVSIIFATASRVSSGTATSGIGLFSVGLVIFIIAIAALAIAGFIMFMVAMHRLSGYYNEPGIFKNVLYALVLTIAEYILIFALEFAFIFSSITRISSPSTSPNILTTFPLFLIAVLVGAVVFGIVNGWLYMRSFNKLKEKSGVDNFWTAGILYLVGTIVPVVGWIAWIFAYMGFHKLQPASTAIPTVSYPYQQMPTKRFCTYCGAENKVDSRFCSNCGKPLQ
jgi:uncharacterized membrane protein